MFKKILVAASIAMMLPAAHAEAGIRLSIGIGIPLFAPPPRPVYVAPPPVYVVPAPAPAAVVVQPAPRPVYYRAPAAVYVAPVPVPVR